jgi:hypothetical protein
VVRHFGPIKRWYAAHGVDDVLVEAREEPKPVLAGHPVPNRTSGPLRKLDSAGVLSLFKDGNAAGLASRNIAALEHHDLEAALDQLVRGAHPRNAAAEDDDAGGHASLFSPAAGCSGPATGWGWGCGRWRYRYIIWRIKPDNRVALFDAQRDPLTNTEQEDRLLRNL